MSVSETATGATPRIRVGPAWLQPKVDAVPRVSTEALIAAAREQADRIVAEATAQREQWYQDAYAEGRATGEREGRRQAEDTAQAALTTLQARWATVQAQLDQLTDWLAWVGQEQTEQRVLALTRQLLESWWQDHPDAWATYVQTFLERLPHQPCLLTISPALDATLQQVCTQWRDATRELTWTLGDEETPWDTLLAQWDGGGAAGTLSAVLAATMHGGAAKTGGMPLG